MKSLVNYLSRIGLSSLSASGSTSRERLAQVMEAHSRSIAFENFDIVCGGKISMDAADVERKLVDEQRGGYCWEQNALLKLALEDMGYSVRPWMCRIRWGKPDDSIDGPNTEFTHLALKVDTDDGRSFLADVGFGGTASIQPVSLDVGTEPQQLLEGQFRVVPSKHTDFHVLELLVGNHKNKKNSNKEEDDNDNGDDDDWRPLYEWRDEAAPLVDQIASNWFSCTFPTARFTTQLFACRVVGDDERHHLLNDQYVIRKGYGVNKKVTTEKITTKARLLELIDQVFRVKLVETEGIDRYLRQLD